MCNRDTSLLPVTKVRNFFLPPILRNPHGAKPVSCFFFSSQLATNNSAFDLSERPPPPSSQSSRLELSIQDSRYFISVSWGRSPKAGDYVNLSRFDYLTGPVLGPIPQFFVLVTAEWLDPRSWLAGYVLRLYPVQSFVTVQRSCNQTVIQKSPPTRLCSLLCYSQLSGSSSSHSNLISSCGFRFLLVPL